MSLHRLNSHRIVSVREALEAAEEAIVVPPIALDAALAAAERLERTGEQTGDRRYFEMESAIDVPPDLMEAALYAAGRYDEKRPISWSVPPPVRVEEHVLRDLPSAKVASRSSAASANHGRRWWIPPPLAAAAAFAVLAFRSGPDPRMLAGVPSGTDDCVGDTCALMCVEKAEPSPAPVNVMSEFNPVNAAVRERVAAALTTSSRQDLIDVAELLAEAGDERGRIAVEMLSANNGALANDIRSGHATAIESIRAVLLTPVAPVEYRGKLVVASQGEVDVGAPLILKCPIPRRVRRQARTTGDVRAGGVQALERSMEDALKEASIDVSFRGTERPQAIREIRLVMRQSPNADGWLKLAELYRELADQEDDPKRVVSLAQKAIGYYSRLHKPVAEKYIEELSKRYEDRIPREESERLATVQSGSRKGS